VLDTLRSLKPAGVLLAPLGRHSDKMKIEKFCKNVPTILFDSNIEDLGAAFVGSDNYSFIIQTVEYLTSTGKSPYFFEMRNPANPNANKRIKKLNYLIPSDISSSAFFIILTVLSEDSKLIIKNVNIIKQQN